MGVVYLARDPDLDRFVAVKLLRVTDDEVRERFLREARTTGRLQHPNIVTTYERGEHDGHPFIAMEYVAGETLAELIARRAPLDVERKVELIKQLCVGLRYAHESGIIHRDIKPANLMVTSEGGLLKILDFGIARLAEGSGTMVGVMLGTPAYMSPEQIRGEMVGVRSDVFSVGAVFYELLVHRKAFSGENTAQIHHKILNGTADELPGMRGIVSADLQHVIRRTLARDVDARYPDLGALAADLAAASINPAPEQLDATVVLDRRQDIARRRAVQIGGHLERAREALAAREYETAQEAVEAALVIDPDNADAQTLLAELERAEADQAVEASLDAARNEFEDGDLSAAMRRVDEALQTRPGDSDGRALRLTLEAALETRERQRAQARAIADGIERSRDAKEAGAFERAARAAEEVLALDPEHAEAKEIKEDAATALEERRLREELDQRALAAVDSAKVAFASGEQSEAIQQLEEFDLSHPLVTETLRELRRERDAQEDARRAEEQKQQEEEERRALEVWVGEQVAELEKAIAERRFADAEAGLRTLRKRASAMPVVGTLEDSLRAAREAATAETVAELLQEVSGQVSAEDWEAAQVTIDRLLEVDSENAEAQAFRSDVEEARRQADERRRVTAVGEAMALANGALASEEFDAARGHCKTLLAEYPDEPEVAALLDRIRKSQRAAVVRRANQRVRELGAKLMNGKGLAVAGGAALLVLAVVGLFLRGPETTDVDPGEVAGLLDAGQLVPAAELIETALATEPAHEGFQELAERLLAQAERGLAGPRDAAGAASATLLAGPRAAESEARRLAARGDLVLAVQAHDTAATGYRDAALSGADLDNVATRVRALLTGVWLDEHDLSEEQLSAAAELGEQAQIIAGRDATVTTLVNDIWETARARMGRAEDAASSAGGSTLDMFVSAAEQKDEAEKQREGGDLEAAVSAAVRSASLFGDAGAVGIRIGQIRRALTRGRTALADGRLGEALSEAERGLRLGASSDVGASTGDFVALRDDILDRAESEAVSARGDVPAGVTVDDGESLLEEADSAREDSRFALAVANWVAAAATFEEAATSAGSALSAAVQEIQVALGAGDFQSAAERAAVLLRDAGGTPGRPVLDVISGVREAVERRVMDAKERASVNARHPAFATAEEQELGARQRGEPHQLVESTRYFEGAAEYYDIAAEAATVTRDLAQLIEAWERAFGARDDEELLRLYQPQSSPGQDSRERVVSWLNNFGESRRWDTASCDPVERNNEQTWFATCRVTVTVDGNAFEQSYRWALERRDGRFVFIDVGLVN